MSSELYSPAGPGEHLQRMLQDWYYTPDGPPSAGAAVWDAQPHRIVRVQLDEDWYDCEDSTGHVLILDKDTGKPKPEWQVNLRDPLGIKTGSPLYDVLEGYMPGGVCFWAMETFDGPSPPGDDSDGMQGPYYEPLDFGMCCNEQSSSSPSSSSPSSSSPSSSPSSSSPSSSSPSSTSPSSTSPSTSESESKSHSESHSHSESESHSHSHSKSESKSNSCECIPPPPDDSESPSERVGAFKAAPKPRRSYKWEKQTDGNYTLRWGVFP